MPTSDRLVRRVIKQYGADNGIALRARQHAIIAKVYRILVRAEMSSYCPSGRHPSLVKQDRAVENVIRVNDARDLKPISVPGLQRALPGLSEKNVRTSLGHLNRLGRIRKKSRGYAISSDTIAMQVDATHFDRQIAAIIIGGRELAKLAADSDRVEHFAADWHPVF
jgi:hypothetical protein